MIKRLLTTSFVIIFLGLTAFSAETRISGKIINSNKSELVRILGYRDFITYDLETLGYTYSDKNGNFEIEIAIQDVRYILIDVDFHRADFYLEPGRSYSLELSKSRSKEVAGYGADPYLLVKIISPASNLTRSVGIINDTYNNFMVENVRSSHGRFSKRMATDLGNILIAKAREINEPYITEYTRYLIATLKLTAGSQTKDSLAGEYLSKEKVLVNNIAYMDFFNAFFSKMLVTTPALISMENLYTLVNFNNNYHALSDTLKNTEYLGNKELRELVLLKNLYEFYGFPGFNKEKVLLFINQIKNNAGKSQIASIAGNILEDLNGQRIENPVALTALSGEKIIIGVPGKKYTYLCFIDGSLLSVAEVSLLQEIATQYSDYFDFICINATTDQSTFRESGKQNRENIIYAFPEDLPSLLNTFRIYKVPRFVLLSSSGKIAGNPAPAPSEDLAGYLRKILDKR